MAPNFMASNNFIEYLRIKQKKSFPPTNEMNWIKTEKRTIVFPINGDNYHKLIELTNE